MAGRPWTPTDRTFSTEMVSFRDEHHDRVVLVQVKGAQVSVQLVVPQDDAHPLLKEAVAPAVSRVQRADANRF